MKWERVESSLLPKPRPRTEGLHLSSLIREIERDVYGDDARPGGQIPQGFAEGGFLWEALCETMAKRYLGRKVGRFQTESLVDGVWMTDDWFRPDERRVYDFKQTWKSVASIGKWDEKFLGYMVQLKSHCRRRKTTKGALVFMFVMGDWKRGPEWSGPVGPVQINFEFEPEELERNWRMVLRYRDAWIKRGGPKPYKPGAKKRGTVTDEQAFSF